MNTKGYSVLGWVVWQIGSRVAKRKVAQNRTKIGIAGAVAAGVVAAGFATRLRSNDS